MERLRKKDKVEKKILYSIIIIIVGILLGFVLLLVAYSLPTEMMETRIKNSSKMLQEEFDNDVVLNRFEGTYLGTFTDCLMMQSAIYDTDNHSLVDSAIHIYRKEISEKIWMPGVSLMNYLSDRSGEEVSYTRYWHGYLVFLKPILLFFDLAEIRLLNLTLLSSLLLGIAYLLFKKNKGEYMIALGIAMLSIYPTGIYMSLSHSICIFIMLASMLIYLKFDKRINHDYNYIYFFLITGMMTSYMDLLTYPILPLGASLILYVSLFKPKFLEGVIYFIVSGISYFFGYVFMWVGKWMLAWVFGVRDIWKDAFTTVAKRSGGIDQLGALDSKVETITRNIGVLINKPLILLVFLFLVGIIILSIKNKKINLISSRHDILLLLILFLLPFAWYFFAANHSYIHYMFTFRSLFISVFALLSVFILLVDTGDTDCVGK